MDDLNNKQGSVLIISPTEGFLARSVVSKIETSGLTATLFHGETDDIDEIDRQRDQIELVVLFMDEGVENMTETLVYLKDMVNDIDRKIILIGEIAQYEFVCKTIPETIILKWFNRPLVMDDLIKCILQYMEENTGAKRKKTVLIVDDDITYMRMVYEWLKENYHVSMAESGVQAISYLAKNKADLILLDYEMPIADGPQILAMLKNDSETGQIPVMFLTGHGDKESVLSVIDLKPVDYLLKTIDKDSLLKKLEDFFRKKPQSI